MSVVTFVTLKFAKRLEKAGMDSAQSEAFAEAQKDAFAEALETQLATKADMYDIRSELKLMRWMIAFNLVFTMTMLWKIFI